MSLRDPRLANASTASYLTRAITAVDPPPVRMMPGAPVYRHVDDRLKMGLDCDEVFPGIYLGTGPTLRNMKYLRKLGITHVINTAENDGLRIPQPTLRNFFWPRSGL